MTCPARARCSDSRPAGATGFRSGRRTASASRSSRIATATSRIFRQAADGTCRRTPHEADPGTSHAPESWSPKDDTLLFSVTKGADMSLWAFSCGQEGDAARRVHRRLRPAPCSPPTDDGSPTRARSGTRRPSLFSRSRRPGPASALLERVRLPETSALVAGRQGALLQPEAAGVRVGQHHDAAGVQVRERRRGAEAAPDGSRRLANELRHHAGRRFMGLVTAGKRSTSAARPDQIQRRAELVRGAQGASASLTDERLTSLAGRRVHASPRPSRGADR